MEALCGRPGYLALAGVAFAFAGSLWLMAYGTLLTTSK